MQWPVLQKNLRRSVFFFSFLHLSCKFTPGYWQTAGALKLATLLQIYYLCLLSEYENKIKLGRHGYCHFAGLCHSLRIIARIAQHTPGFWHQYHTQFILRMGNDRFGIHGWFLFLISWLYKAPPFIPSHTYFFHGIYLPGIETVLYTAWILVFISCGFPDHQCTFL